MPFPTLDTGPAFHVALKWERTGQYALNTLSFHVDAGGTDADLATALDAQALVGMTPDQVDSAHVTEYLITPYDGVSAGTPHIPVFNWVGHTGGQPVPAVSQVVSFHTGTASRRARGRIYLPFVSEAAIDSGLTTSGNTVTAAAAWNTFLSGMADDGFTPIIASTITAHTHTVHNVDGSVSHGVPTGVGAIPTSYPILRATMTTKLATQRRRQSRV